jgi:hypothetical protein
MGQIQSKRSPKQDNNVMNNFHYTDKLITVRDDSIKGRKTYLQKLPYHSSCRSEKFRIVGSKGVPIIKIVCINNLKTGYQR